MSNDLQVLTSVQIELHKQAWIDQLGRVYAERLRELLPLFANGKASLAEALQVVAPGKDRASGLAAYQTFLVRVNDAANEAELSFRLALDSKKKSDPSERETWIEGPSPDLENLEEYSREATSIIRPSDPIVAPTAVILNSDELQNPESQKPLIRFFVSYAHKNDIHVQRLLEPLCDEFRISKKFRFETWTDRKIVVGTHWHDEIQAALKDCDFGLLMVSREFLASEYIAKNELPHFVKGGKPVIPVGLAPVEFQRVDMKGLEEKQIFRLHRDGDSPRFFTKCRAPMDDEFVRELANKIEDRVANYLKQSKATQSNNASSISQHFPEKGSQGIELVEKLLQFIRYESPLPKVLVDPHGTRFSISSNERREELMSTQNRTLAVDFLAEWATSADRTRFCAVLGEVGIGKTTTLMLLSRELEKRREKDPSVPVPIFIDLKDYYFDGEPELEDILRAVIKRHWRGDAGQSITPEMIVDAVRERGALVIFDGLDERIIPLPHQRRDAFIRKLWSILPPLRHKPKPGTRPGRLIISCRSHYFPTVSALSSAFTGDGREGIRPDDYTACVILPFNEEQVRDYIGQIVGADRLDDAMAVIHSVHNLTDLSSRPMLLSLITPELAELERMRQKGRTVYGVTLYGLFVDKWLERDGSKHQFTPEHKKLMMEELAGHLDAVSEKKLPWERLSKWLDNFLQRHPEIRDRYKDKSAEVLNQDFRAATFCLRPDDEKDGFRFAHTSLLEYFLAIHLIRALEERDFTVWDRSLPSDETLDFAGQILAEGQKADVAAVIAAWSQLLNDGAAPANARRVALKMWIVAHRNGWPTPHPVAPQLQGLDLEGWQIGAEKGAMFDLRSASLVGTCLDHAVLKRVLLSGANASAVSARLTEMHDVSLDGSNWDGANLCGGTLRNCDFSNSQLSTVNWHDCDLTHCQVDNASLPDQWRNEAAIDVSETLAVVLRQGHSGGVDSVSWSPDGMWVLSGGYDNTLKLWDASSGRCLQTFAGHDGFVRSVSWSPDGTRVLSGSDDKSLKLWDASSGICLLTLDGHENGVASVSWSPDGTRFVSGSLDKTRKLWDASSGICMLTLTGGSAGVNNVSWSPDGTRVLSGGDDNTLKLWDASSGRCLQTFVGHEGYVYSVSWSPDGTRVLSGSLDLTLKLWDASSGRCLQTFARQFGVVLSVVWLPDGTHVLSASNDNTLTLWDASTGRCMQTFSGHDGFVCGVSRSPDGTRILSGSSDKALKLWEASSGRCLLTFAGNDGSALSVSWSPNGTRVLSGGLDDTLKLWDASSGRCVQTFAGHEGPVYSVSWSPDGTRVLSGSYDKTLKVWDASSGSCLQVFAGHRGAVFSVSWSPNGTRVLSGGLDDTLKLWDASSGRCLQTFAGHSDAVLNVSWSPNGTHVFSASFDKTLKLWDASSGRCLQTFVGHGGSVNSASWSPNGPRILSGGADNTLRLWDASSGRCLQTFVEHGGYVLSVSWSPDGTRVLSGSGDKTLKMWDVSSGRCLQTFTGHSGGVLSVSWSPDGARVISAGGDGTMREWDVESGKELRAWVIDGDEVALVNFPENKILHATPNAWRLLGWQGFDHTANRRRLFPAEIYGPLPPW